MSKKYVIDLPDDAQYILINGASENHCYTRVEQVDDLEELNSDYINEHYGELQDEAYQKGFTDGKTSAEKGCDGCKHEHAEADGNPCRVCRACTRGYIDQYEPAPPSDRIEVGDEVRAEEGHVFVVTGITDNGSIYGFDKDGMWLVRVKDCLRKTGKHYDIQSILEAMRTHD